MNANPQVRFARGDIARVEADVIVNAANSALAGGGGVDGAVHRAAGPSVMAELDSIRATTGHCPAGGMVVTGAGRLQARYIVHAVGPVYRDGKSGEAELLASCYSKALAWAAENSLKSIAFPAISAGVYGYPMDQAAAVAIRATQAFLPNPGSVETITFVLYTDDALRIFEKAWRDGA